MNWSESSYGHQQPWILFTVIRLACQRISIIPVLGIFGKSFLIIYIFLSYAENKKASE